ncbi:MULTISPECIES: hypothetical protein [Pseudomonas]|uniref:Uncharacterized protein n=1 Tax=Pseudomonas fluorescens TaxID=294 RepID=A0A166QMI5_PSEFL|nr:MULTISPECIES: hypothetical protein [Pseudomonas]KZN20530.1 hypothetical protein A1D17_03030 [Pseudomonas fluorescens]
MNQSSNEYKGFPVSAAGPYQQSAEFPDGHWYGTMGGTISTTPVSTREAAIAGAKAAVDKIVGDFLHQHGEKGQELLDLTDQLLKLR